MLKAETVAALSELVPSQIVSQVFGFYCTPMVGGTQDEFSLDTDKVCRFYGDFLLAANTAYLLAEFLEMWQNVSTSVIAVYFAVVLLCTALTKHNLHVGSHG